LKFLLALFQKGRKKKRKKKEKNILSLKNKPIKL